MDKLDSLGSVQQKLPCAFKTAVVDESSAKRDNQLYKVVATETIKPAALADSIHAAVATEKVDGTCVFITSYNGRPWLWARFDRKPTKAAEKKFRKFQMQNQKENDKNEQKYKWDLTKDFKETPADWIPASGVMVEDGFPMPDDIGHTPGWVPVSQSSRQYCWHLSAVSLVHGYALVLREDKPGGELSLELVSLSHLNGHTAELIGTNINGNPYDIGSKKHPLHMLVLHGSLAVCNGPTVAIDTVKEWFLHEGQVEGIVWQCENKHLYKVHRNHVALPWPGSEVPLLSRRPVCVHVDPEQFGEEKEVVPGAVFLLKSVSGNQFGSLRDLGAELGKTAGQNSETSTKIGDLT